MAHNDYHILKYFNDKGQEFLQMAAQLTEGEDAYLANLENIRAQINNFQKVDSRDSQALFEIPILKLYSKDIEQG